MIDNLSILISLIGVGYVVMRAYVLNTTLPWFGKGPAIPPAKRRTSRTGR